MANLQRYAHSSLQRSLQRTVSELSSNELTGQRPLGRDPAFFNGFVLGGLSMVFILDNNLNYHLVASRLGT